MKRLVGLIVAVTLLVGLVAVVAGCGTTQKEGNGILTPQGEITINKTGDSVVVKKGNNTKTWTAASVTEKALDFPVPSDAKLLQGTAIQVSGAPGAEKWLGGKFYSNEDVNTVVNFYKSELSSMEGFSDTSTQMNGQLVGLFSVKVNGTVKSVIISAAGTGQQGKTLIQIATVSGAGV